MGIINNIWGKRHRVKTYSNGSTSPLYKLSSWTQTIVYADFVNDEAGERFINKIPECVIPGPDQFDYDQAEKIEKARDQIKELIELAKESEDESQRFRARVFEYSTLTYKDPRKFSRASGIPYFVCWKATNDFKKQLKNDISPDSPI